MAKMQFPKFFFRNAAQLLKPRAGCSVHPKQTFWQGWSMHHLRFSSSLSNSSLTKSHSENCHTLAAEATTDAASVDAFNHLFPSLVDDVLDSMETKWSEDMITLFREVCEYNVPGGKHSRGHLVVQSFALLQNSTLARMGDVGSDSADGTTGCSSLDDARILGWCVEFLQAYMLVADDLMDGSLLRRGRPAWHACHGVGVNAVNDASFLLAAVFALLRRHFSHRPSVYIQLVDLFNSVHMQTIVGQSMDMHSCYLNPVLSSQRDIFSPNLPRSCNDITQLTRQRYQHICEYKTSMYSFYLPVFGALRLVSINSPALEAELKDVLLQLGYLFQSQDDFIDCYGDPASTGKIGTDIQEGKCTWLLTEALELATPAVKDSLAASYGRDNDNCVAAVKQIYNHLELPERF